MLVTSQDSFKISSSKSWGTPWNKTVKDSARSKDSSCDDQDTSHRARPRAGRQHRMRVDGRRELSAGRRVAVAGRGNGRRKGGRGTGLGDQL